MWDIIFSGWTPALLALVAFNIWQVIAASRRARRDRELRDSAFLVKCIKGGPGWSSTYYKVRCLFCDWETNTGRVPAGRCARCGGRITKAPPQVYVKPEPTPAPPPRRP